MSGALLVCGTHSDAGKSVVTAGLCRWLRRRGVSVAPFKAQNMALNSVVTPGGAEIGRAQAVQAAAAGVEPEAAMNPVLIKPSGERHSQVIVMGRPYADTDARSYQALKAQLRPIVEDALADLRARYDVVVCEGAGSPAEINLRAGDITNMGLARAAGLPVLVVGDIDRGGVFASLFGTLALLDSDDQALVAGFVINKFRGDATILAPGLEDLRERTGRPVLGVLPFVEDLWMDVEDSLALEAPAPEAAAPAGGDTLDVAVVRLRWMSNFTDVDALGSEPGVRVRFTRSPADLERADLVVVPGTKATVEDLARLRAAGLDCALAARAATGGPILGICGGYQMLGERIEDGVEAGAALSRSGGDGSEAGVPLSRSGGDGSEAGVPLSRSGGDGSEAGVPLSRSGGDGSGAGAPEAVVVDGLGLLPVTTVFQRDKLLRRRAGVSAALGGARTTTGYEIRHGRVARHDGEPLLRADDGEPDGCRAGAVYGTSWHGAFEDDGLRRALLSAVAAARGRTFVPGTHAFADRREARLDALGDLVERHLDTDAVLALLRDGAPTDLPTLGVVERSSISRTDSRTPPVPEGVR